MKKITTVLCTLTLLLGMQLTNAQNYTLTVDTATYVPQSQPNTSLNLNQVWDDPNWGIVLTFPFNFMGMPVDTVYVMDGHIAFDANNDYVVRAYGADLADKGSCMGGTNSISSVVWKTDSSGANWNAVIEWDNFGFQVECDSSQTMNEYGTAQVWLYGGSNNIAMHYGAKLVFSNSLIFGAGNTGPSVGLHDFANGTHFSLSGDPINPTLQTTESNLSDAPSDGQRYTFEAPFFSVDPSVQTFALHLFPVPANDLIRMYAATSNESVASILDMTGKVVAQKDLSTSGSRTNAQFDISNLPSGIYMMQVRSIDGVATKKFVKE